MTDYTELKRLANNAIGLDDSAYIPCQVAFQRAANPHAVLALIAENERLATHARLAGVSAEVTVHQEVGRAITETLAVTIERDKLKAENEALRKDAGRWRAFINCARIKFFGWAGYGERDPYGNSPGNYRHFGGEFWTIHDAPTADKEKAAEILNGFADAAVAAMGKGEQS